MKICSFASGSNGNCIYVGTSEANILIDAGISGKKTKAGLDAIGVIPEQINAIVVTHEHSDHIKGLGVISRKYNIPIYATTSTWEAISESGLTGKIDRNLFNEVIPDTDFTINGLVIHPFSTSHDASNPVGYTFTNRDKKISVATDLGCYDSYTAGKLAGSNLLFIEANHDIDMLNNGRYPRYLKKRILSDKGHLSNEMSGSLLADVYSENLKYAVLGHLSAENNNPDLAYKAVKNKLLSAGIKPGVDISLTVSAREGLSPMIKI